MGSFSECINGNNKSEKDKKKNIQYLSTNNSYQEGDKNNKKIPQSENLNLNKDNLSYNNIDYNKINALKNEMKEIENKNKVQQELYQRLNKDINELANKKSHLEFEILNLNNNKEKLSNDLQ